MNLAPIRIRIEKDVVTKVHRNLAGKGKYLVAVGQEVTPEEIIGTSEVSSGFITINLANSLGIPPSDAEKYLRKKIGSKIYTDELLAYKSAWLFKKAKVVTCPIDGVLDFINKKTGEVRITRLPQKINLPAGVYGVVEEVDNTNGRVTIRTQVSRVFGLCGSGRMRDGILHILTKRYDLAEKTMISAKFNGAILVNGSLISRDSIITAISNDISGIITGGINATDYKSIAGSRLTFPKKLENDIGVSIVICEGFGSQALGEDIYEILSSYEGKFVQLDGNHAVVNLPSYESSCMLKIRKTKLPPNMVLKEDIQLTELKIGQKVRVIGSSFASEQGKITIIDKSKTKLASRIYANLLTLETSRRKIQVPAINVEVISP